MTTKDLYLAAAFDGMGNLLAGIWIDTHGVVHISELDDMNVAEGVTDNVSDGDTIAHTLWTTPTVAFPSGTVAGDIITPTAIGSDTFTVAIKKHDGTPGTTQTIYWRVRYIP